MSGGVPPKDRSRLARRGGCGEGLEEQCVRLSSDEVGETAAATNALPSLPAVADSAGENGTRAADHGRAEAIHAG